MRGHETISIKLSSDHTYTRTHVSRAPGFKIPSRWRLVCVRIWSLESHQNREPTEKNVARGGDMAAGSRELAWRQVSMLHYCSTPTMLLRRMRSPPNLSSTHGVGFVCCTQQ